MKFFLSHSSADKAMYVKYIADKLGDRAVFDEYTFESGMRTLDEIYRTMQSSDIFVLFLSDAALRSDWVRDEIVNSKRLIDGDNLKRFLPILIDRSIDHRDPRIPSWISEHYNLRLVSRPAVALRRINTAFAQLSLAKHQKFDRRKELFVGRNTELSELERRFDDYTKPVPSAVFVTGLREIGRKSFLLNALKKTNKIERYYEPIRLNLQQEDGIEGFISKVFDIGLYPDSMDISDLSGASLPQKIDMLAELLSAVGTQNEVLLIDDWRSIVRFGGELSEWFLEVCKKLPENKTILAIASAYAPRVGKVREQDRVYTVRLRELDPEERIGLLVRYLRDVADRRDVGSGDFAAFRRVLNGHPEQAIFAAQLIADVGIQAAVERMPEVVEFSSVRASIYLDRYLDDEDKIEFLTFLSWFDFISFELLTTIASDINLPLLDYISEFVEDSICDAMGSVGEYVRLNDVVRDYVARGSLQIPERYANSLRGFAKDMFQNGDYSDFDYSDKYAAVRVSLLEGEHVPESLLIPAHFLGAISQKYKNRKYSDVIVLADRILAKDNYEEYIRSQIRFYLCMSLARTRSNRFMAEVHKVKGVDHNYILGFYYRRIGRYNLALERLEKAVEEQRWEENAKREMVLIYNIMEEYDQAFAMARDSYRNGPTNPINVQAYFEVLINVPRTANVLIELHATLESISKITSEKGLEVACCMNGQYAFHVDHDVRKAFAILEEGIERFPSSPYPLLAKLEVAVAIKSITDIEWCLARLRNSDAAGYQAKVQIVKAEIMAMALAGQKGKALARINSDLDFIFSAARDRFRDRVSAL